MTKSQFSDRLNDQHPSACHPDEYRDRDSSVGRWLLAVGCWVLIGAVGLLTAGCSSTFNPPTRWAVDLSALDYVQFLLTPPPPSPGEKPTVIKLELTGTGYMTGSAGRSDRVASGFWTERNDQSWDHMESDQVVISRERTGAYFQRLVDLGFFDRKFPGLDPDDDASQALAVLGSINKRKQVRLTADPGVRAIFDELLGEF